jgi:hypothetical protein
MMSRRYWSVHKSELRRSSAPPHPSRPPTNRASSDPTSGLPPETVTTPASNKTTGSAVADFLGLSPQSNCSHIPGSANPRPISPPVPITPGRFDFRDGPGGCALSTVKALANSPPCTRSARILPSDRSTSSTTLARNGSISRGRHSRSCGSTPASHLDTYGSPSSDHNRPTPPPTMRSQSDQISDVRQPGAICPATGRISCPVSGRPNTGPAD